MCNYGFGCTPHGPPGGTLRRAVGGPPAVLSRNFVVTHPDMTAGPWAEGRSFVGCLWAIFWRTSAV